MLSIELAGVPVEVRCRYPENERFFAEYITQREPVFTVEPTDEDLEKIRLDFLRAAEADGLPAPRHSRVFWRTTPSTPFWRSGCRSSGCC